MNLAATRSVTPRIRLCIRVSRNGLFRSFSVKKRQGNNLVIHSTAGLKGHIYIFNFNDVVKLIIIATVFYMFGQASLSVRKHFIGDKCF